MAEEAPNLFDSIVELVDAEMTDAPTKAEAEAARLRTTKLEKPQREAAEKEPPETRDGEPTRLVPRPAKRPIAKPASEPAQEFSRAHSKARVQKSVRFRPALIAELETHLRSLELAGRERSIQDVMNDALDLWLEKNARAR